MELQNDELVEKIVLLLKTSQELNTKSDILQKEANAASERSDSTLDLTFDLLGVDNSSGKYDWLIDLFLEAKNGDEKALVEVAKEMLSQRALAN
jgi:hypothetical protein